MAKRKHDPQQSLIELVQEYPATIADLSAWLDDIPIPTMHRIVQRLERDNFLKVENRGRRPKPLKIIAADSPSSFL